ncbi:helix-turn-helix domain-containing protein [Haladaptatus sp. DYF46]|uniref:helix-turn-helix domain-containing protein n=1 Tax=Haladaptatus sp. DYF46 TaxID=2886041 RepID=UPI001E5A7419|nr:helix-turn-helix domain-containing protein [Haladaptatus sp. DYF46]
MSENIKQSTGETFRTSQISLRIWHPKCWTLLVTENADAGLIGHGVYEHDGVLEARMTAYGDTTDAIDELVENIRESSLTLEVKVINEYFGSKFRTTTAGNATEELLVEYEPRYSIHDALISRGFVPEEKIRVHDGYEYWTVNVDAPRSEIHSRLDEVRRQMDADITVEGMKSAHTSTVQATPSAQLSERQREIFEFAQREGYYTWPRETSASALAARIGVSKTTFLEHLRKAEAKILGQTN